ncbi:uncharacterized protein LOC115960997 isoform X2 [Quercus lobata]|uniref:uncharacterized protein LOC115960997 isoform X2 n=1 Tax=Quercus lobata TaxID=97700 RepID=UPI0012461C6D|nr:uncharacterized protein LOC115960997 isoform X2 [Quercus lobata]
MVKLGEFCGSSVNLRCQLLIGDLETLISITSDDRLRRNGRRSYLRRGPAVDSQSFLLRPFVRLQLSQRTISGSLLKYLSKLQVDEEPAIRTNTTILLGNIASHLNEGALA